MKAAARDGHAAEARIRGSTRSDSFPAKGEKRVIITGWAMSTRPASWGFIPLMYWRLEAQQESTAEVAL